MHFEVSGSANIPGGQIFTHEDTNKYSPSLQLVHLSFPKVVQVAQVAEQAIIFEVNIF